METLKILTPEERTQISHITQRINSYLSTKTLWENVKQDEENKSVIAGVTFFYKYITGNNGVVENVILCWDVHPSKWDFDSILKETSELENDLQTKLFQRNAEKGNEAFGSNPFYNPFR